VALTADDIHARASSRGRVAVEIEGVDTFYVTKFSARDRDRFEQIVTGGKVGGVPNMDNVRAKFVALVVVDENGKKRFSESDTDKIGEWDSDIVQAIVDAGFKLNGIGINAVEEAAGK
jgi:hypothetical protein